MLQVLCSTCRAAGVEDPGAWSTKIKEMKIGGHIVVSYRSTQGFDSFLEPRYQHTVQVLYGIWRFTLRDLLASSLLAARCLPC